LLINAARFARTIPPFGGMVPLRDDLIWGRGSSCMSRRQLKWEGTQALMEEKMTRQATIAVAGKLAVLVGLLSATAAYAQQGASSDLSPAKSNCDSKTGCANYATGNVTSKNPTTAPANSMSATGPGGDLSPAKSNCDSNTGCANYSTGDVTKDKPAQQK
jgi:hypothetical protein